MIEEHPEPEDFLAGPTLMQDAFPPLPVCWPALTPKERSEQFQALADWINWLTACYTLDQRVIPACWSKHTALIEELSALRTAWLSAFAATAPGSAPLEWHSHFSTARQRLADWVSRTGCRPGAHRP